MTMCTCYTLFLGSVCLTTLGIHLGRSSEVNDAIQLNVLAKLAVQPAVPVLVH